MRILGVDPGSHIAGFACIESKKDMPLRASDFRIVDAGALKFCKKTPHRNRISQLHEEIYPILLELKPNFCVIERAFFSVNVSSTIKLGEARGALIAAAGRCSVEVVEYSPRQAKKMIAGHGQCSKQQVADALHSLLGFSLGKLPLDVADALALALSFGLDRVPAHQLSRSVSESIRR